MMPTLRPHWTAHRLPTQGEKLRHIVTPYWTEIIRRMSTQKADTMDAVNALGEKVIVRLCSTSNKSAADIFEMLGYKKDAVLE